MTTTTSYGNFHNTIEQHVNDAFGSEGPDGYDVDGIVAEFRTAINDALPDDVSLCGNEFIGPYFAADQNFDGYPLTDDGALDLAAIIGTIDLWAIIDRHGLTS